MTSQVLNGRYTLEAELGRGGMGVVYRAKDQQLDRHVAVKILPAEFNHNPQFLDRFKREILSSAKLDSPHIVQVYDVGQDGTTNYYVTQSMAGNDLHSEIQNRGAFSLDETVRTIGQVAEALDHAHSHGIVHRDIKPGNILLDTNGNARVFDFGIAKTVEGTRMTGGMIGTPEYMSPEQARGDEVDGSSDQYSLAIVAFEMLTGTTPFRSDTSQPWALVNKHISEPPPDPRSLKGSIPEHASMTLLRGLAKIAAHRFDSCAQFAAALAGKIISTPIEDDARVPAERSTILAPKQISTQTAPKADPGTWIFLSAAFLVLLVGGIMLVWSQMQRSSADDSEITQIVETAVVEGLRQASGLSNNSSSSTQEPQTVDVKICEASGMLAGPYCINKSVKTFTAGNQPIRACDQCSAPQPPPSIPLDSSEVESLIETWRQAWCNRDISALRNCYDRRLKMTNYKKNGRVDKYNYSEYMAHENKMFNTRSYISLSVGPLSIEQLGNDKCRVSFIQYYESNAYKSRGKETMIIERTPNGLQIVEDVFRPL